MVPVGDSFGLCQGNNTKRSVTGLPFIPLDSEHLNPAETASTLLLLGSPLSFMKQALVGITAINSNVYQVQAEATVVYWSFL